MSTAESRRAHQLVLMNLGVRIDHLVRSIQIYPDDHPALDTAVTAVIDLIGEALTNRGAVTFSPAGRRFVVDGVAVPAPRSHRTPLAQLEAWLEDRGVGGLELRAAMGPSSLVRTIRIIDEQPGGGMPGPDVINLKLDEAGMRALRVTPRRVAKAVGPADETLTELRMYLRTVRAVQRMHERGMSPAVLIELHQLAEAIVELADQAPRKALTLTEPRRMVPHALRHPVHVALVSVLLGQRFDLDRPVLVELAICALCADAGKASLDPELRRAPGNLTADEQALRSRHTVEATRQLLQLPELHAQLRRRLLVAFEQALGDDLGGTPEVLRWGARHPFSRVIGLASAWDDLRSATGRTRTPAAALARQMAERQQGVHPAVLFAHLEGLLAAYA